MIIYLVLFFSLVIQVHWLVEFDPLKPNDNKRPDQDKDISTFLYDQPQEKKINTTG